MKTIGLLGGMSWESTVSYYRIVNTVVKERLGGLHSARCLLYSVDFQEIEACQSAGDWDRSALLLGAAAQNLEKGGADFIVICTNTMHKVAPGFRRRSPFPCCTSRTSRPPKSWDAACARWACWARVTPWKRIFTAAGCVGRVLRC